MEYLDHELISFGLLVVLRLIHELLSEHFLIIFFWRICNARQLCEETGPKFPREVYFHIVEMRDPFYCRYIYEIGTLISAQRHILACNLAHWPDIELCLETSQIR